MKILCVQLARFGDIYQSWPTLYALKRLHPGAELHFLVRERFLAATVGLGAVDKVIALPSKDIFLPLLAEHLFLEGAVKQLSCFTDGLAAQKYDLIINLSFSPASSYLVDVIASPTASIRGYTRHKDGFLCIPDDASSYFYAQVGTERNNRIHITDLFALVAGVELQECDFTFSVCATTQALPPSYLVIHIGASSRAKSCATLTWEKIVSGILDNYSGHIVFVGAKGEEEFVPLSRHPERVLNLVGRTNLQDLFGILQKAQILVGGDSVALHIASLTQTPTLNVSFANVRFWETGPRARGSRVLWFESNEHVDESAVVQEIKLMLEGKPASSLSIEKLDAAGVLYKLNGYREDDFTWELIRALYMNIEFPITDSATIRHGFMRLRELAILGLEQMTAFQDVHKRSLAVSILDEIDILVIQVAKLVPEVSPVVRWFQTEKLRIGPASMNEILMVTRSIFEKLRDICQIYELNQAFSESLSREDHTWKP